MKTIKIKVNRYDERCQIINSLALSGYSVRVVEVEKDFGMDYYVIVELPNDCVIDEDNR